MTEKKENNGRVTMAVLNNEVAHVKLDVAEIKNIYLPELEKRISGVYKRLDGGRMWLIATLTTVIISLVVTLFQISVRQ